MRSSIDDIPNCIACPLHNFQAPIVDTRREANVIWVGLSAKRIADNFTTPLDLRSKSGNLIQRIEYAMPAVQFYATNLVKCAPLDEKMSKIRYPSAAEKQACKQNLEVEIRTLHPQCIVLLGSLVAKAVLEVLNIKNIHLPKDYTYNPISVGGKQYLFIHHPSYISVYKRKDIDMYIQRVKEGILRSLTQ